MIDTTVQGPRSDHFRPFRPPPPLRSLRLCVRLLPLASCLSPLACLFVAGCAAQTRVGLESVVGELATVKATVEGVHAAVCDLSDTNEAGRDVNEPVTGWILAAGYAAVPLTLLMYAVAHRFHLFRRLKYGREAR